MPNTSQVLIIDDDKAMPWLYSQILDGEGVTCSIAHTVREAIAIIQSQGMPQVIFLDCNMPRESGFDFLNLFEKISPPRCPVIGFSSFSKGIELIAEFEARVDCYVEKPDDLDRFLEIVYRFIPSPMKNGANMEVLPGRAT